MPRESEKRRCNDYAAFTQLEAYLLATDVPIRLAKIRLRMTWTMAQWHEHLPRPQHLRRDILTHDRVATAKALFVPQPLESPIRRVTLFLVNAAVAFKNGVNPRHKRPSFLDAGRSRRRYPGGTEKLSIFVIVFR